MSDTLNNPSLQNTEPTVEPVRGGIVTSFVKTTQNILVRTAELHATDATRSLAFQGYEPMRPVKNITGLATVATLADQSALAFGRGDYTQSAQYAG